MTREEKQKAIDALKISAPVMAMTQEEFNDYIRTLNKVTDWLEQEPCEDCISRKEVCDYIAEFVNHEYATDREHEMVEHIISGIQHLPSIQPKPKTGWIPLKTRPMTEEETEHYFEYTDMRIDDTYTILDCPLPDDGQEVLVSWGGNVVTDVFIKDDSEGCYFEGVDIDEVDAWMPLPKPYKAESEEKE